MRAAVYRGSGDVTIESRPIPRPSPEEVLIRVAAVGICGTDAHEYQSGPHMFTHVPFVPGHEFAGHVVELGSAVTELQVDDLVAVGAGISCGKCQSCQAGATNLCATYETLGLQIPGGLAEYVVAPASICLEVGTIGLSPDVAALTQPMSIAVHAMKRGRPAPDDLVTVIGAGGIGAFLIHALAKRGTTSLVVDLDLERLEVARALGADFAVLPEATANTLSQHLGDRIPSVIYEVTGATAGLELAMSLSGPGTRVVVVGLQNGRHAIDFRSLALRENELIGTNAHAFAADFEQASHLLASRTGGWADIAPVAISLEDLVERGLRPMAEGTADRIKTLIDPWATEERPTS